MRQVRSGVFETNSSSTHSLTICTEEEFNKWKAGELLFCRYEERFAETVPMTESDKDDAKQHYYDTKSAYWKDWEQLSEDEVKSWYAKYANDYLRKKSYDMQTYQDYIHEYELERFERHYTTPNGEKIVAFGKYGYN